MPRDPQTAVRAPGFISAVHSADDDEADATRYAGTIVRPMGDDDEPTVQLPLDRQNA